MNYDTLPESFWRIRTLDMQKDKKWAAAVNVAALVVLLALLIPAGFWIPLRECAGFDGRSFGEEMLFWGLLLVGAVGYIFAHELIHGAAIRLLGRTKPTFGFTGLFAYAACQTKYISKKPYAVIALAPLVLITAALLPLCFLVPRGWFWLPYFVMAANISGSVGDIGVVWMLLRAPRDVLVIDRGTAMEFYSAEKGRRR
ncbi:MAG: DUF3267 domain-containing protein [Oscillospiraceae bacterium]|jgi:hypothetical protein|nr:DUF3267 domain-containing protein [Oscillospiraceae bacterium]